MDTIEELGEGVRRFRSQIFPARRALFRRLARAQEPKALFLTCADSRVVPSLITHTGPGELFIERNPGNIAPVYEERAVGVSASIEYAIRALHTHHIIVCGHSDCGAVKGIYRPEALAEMPAVARWLGHGARARAQLMCDGGPEDEAARLQRLTRLNVVVQMENLLTHPCVREALEEGTLSIHGWVYDIGSGEVEAYDAERGGFTLFPWDAA